MAHRSPLTIERIVSAAVAVADRRGLAAVSMRNVGGELGVEAMSLYHHVVNKDALLDALVDWLFRQIEPPPADRPWRRAMAERAASLRALLVAHPWGLGLVESRRAASPALLRHHDAVLANLRHDGFSVALAASAFSVIDAYVYGFALTETHLPFGDGETAEDFVTELGPALGLDAYPHLAEMIAEEVVGREYTYGREFTLGLELILDGLARRFDSEIADPASGTGAREGHTGGMSDEREGDETARVADNVPTPEEQEILLDAYDLDGDGKVSIVEDARATLGIVDAKLEEIAEEGGVRGKLADAARKVVDKIDND